MRLKREHIGNAGIALLAVARSIRSREVSGGTNARPVLFYQHIRAAVVIPVVALGITVTYARLQTLTCVLPLVAIRGVPT